MVSTLLILLFVSSTLADFDAHIFAEENHAIGDDKYGVPLDNIDEINIQNDDQGSGTSPTVTCGGKYEICSKNLVDWITLKCRKEKRKCCLEELRHCHSQSETMKVYKECDINMLSC